MRGTISEEPSNFPSRSNICYYKICKPWHGFAWPHQFTRLALIDILIISTGCVTLTMESEVDFEVVSFTLELIITFMRRCGQV